MRWLTLLMAVLLLFAACSTDRPEDAATGDNGLIAAEPPRLLDPGARTDMGSITWEVFDHVEEFAVSADAVFVAQVAEVVEDFAVDEDEEDPGGIQIVHDGIVFEVLDAIKGELDDTVTIAHPSLLRTGGTSAAQSETLIKVEPIDVLADGIRTAGTNGSPTYLVLANYSDLGDGPMQLALRGPGSIALVDIATGVVTFAEAPPFAAPSELNLDIIRAWMPGE